MSAATPTTEELAIVAWVKAATGYTDAQIVWDDQSGSRPPAPYAALRVMESISVARPDYTWAYDAGRPVGQEIEHTVTDIQDFGLSFQIFSLDVIGANAAHNILNRAKLALMLQGVRDALAAGGLVPYDVGDVFNLAERFGPDFFGRASLEVRFYVKVKLTEKTGYISTLEGTATFDGISQPYKIPPD